MHFVHQNSVLPIQKFCRIPSDNVDIAIVECSKSCCGMLKLFSLAIKLLTTMNLNKPLIDKPLKEKVKIFRQPKLLKYFCFFVTFFLANGHRLKKHYCI